MDLVISSPRDRVTGIITDTEHGLDKSISEPFVSDLEIAYSCCCSIGEIGLDNASSSGR